MINFDDLKAEFDKRQEKRERNFNAATMMARVMLADFPADLLPSRSSLTTECDVYAEWLDIVGSDAIMAAQFTPEKTYLNNFLRGYPDPKDPKYGVELLAEVRAARAYKEPDEVCTHCNQPLPARGDE